MDDFHELCSNTPAGQIRRKAFFRAIEATKYEFQALGTDMNQRYRSSGIYQADQGEMPALEGDPVLDHTRSTYPGCRLPHVWLNKALPQKPVSSIDLVGKGRFTILTGIGGEAWKDAAKEAGKVLCIPITGYSIGFRQDWEDIYFDWEHIREIKEDGCILIRPDRYIAWRSVDMVQKPAQMLLQVLTTILSR